MPGKSDKCCCCPGRCVNIGTLFINCDHCAEVALDWYVSRMYGRISGAPGTTLFQCCDRWIDVWNGQSGNLLPGDIPLRVILVGDLNAADCRAWNSTGSLCSNNLSVTVAWHMEMISPGVTKLLLNWSDGRQAAWICEKFRCLCPNIFTRLPSEDIGDVESCGLPEKICITPFDACCMMRTRPVPRRLQLRMTNQANCPCGVGGFNLDWDATTNKWTGTGPFGTCGTGTGTGTGTGDDLTISVWCTRILPQTSTHWHYSFSSVCAGSSPPGGLDVFQIAECDPIHLQWVSSFTGCCGSVNAQTLFDVVEV